jgi:ribosome-associated protein
VEAIKDCLDDNKAEDIVTIDLAGKSSLADAMIIASGNSTRHVGAIADHVMKRLKELGLQDVQVEGLPSCDWVLVDAGDIIVHIFRPEVRQFYRLERLWLEEAPLARAN